jgi:FkbM family methyltransferase
MAELHLRLNDGSVIAVPASLESITTYVLLEQEAWFEKEVAFLLRWLRPGMTAIDIGANLGVYSLPMARRVAPDGQVFAFEPASEPRLLLERSRSLNRANNLRVIGAALSDSRREGHLTLGASSELNSLEGSGPGESVPITCLDLEDGTAGWTSVDFVKIDAEGEEERILAGGKAFFDRHSPLVMFEIKAGNAVNENLRSAFPRLGYGVYRLLAGAPVLLPDEPGQPLDAFELNLFAAKPDRAAMLAREGLLIESLPGWTPNETARRKAVELLRAQAFASDFAAVLTDNTPVDPEYYDGLAGYAAWRSPELSSTERCAALDFACRRLVAICEKAATLARLSTLARVAWEAGRRMIATKALRVFGEMVIRGDLNVSEPFWPASHRFDGLAPGAKRGEWLLVSAFEAFECRSSFSSRFASAGIDLDWLCAQPFASTEMERRRILRRARAGERTEVPARLCVQADDHVNADVWRAGLVPNTWVPNAAPSAGAEHHRTLVGPAVPTTA